jgi:peptidoglycan/LPS O-acetylase OafA/YrhL
MQRRHDIDALRALAFGLVILYHLAMYYVADWHWHIKSPHAAPWLQGPMRALNLWRMPLVFLISGIAIAMLRRGHGGAALLRSRSARLLLPLAFGMAVVVPFQPYAQGVANGLIAPGFGDFLTRYFTGGPWPAGAFDGAHVGVTWNHLWYLAYLWAYTVLLVAALPLLESAAGRRLARCFAGLRGWALLLLPALPLLAWTLALWPRFPVTHDLIGDWWMHAVYFTLFVYGWWIGTDTGLWAEAARLRWRALALALGLLALYFGLRALLPLQASGPGRQLVRLVADLYLWSAVVAVLGWGHRHLNCPWPWLRWANTAVYPWYVLHQTAIIAAAWWLAPLGLGAVVEAGLLLVATVAACAGVAAVLCRVRVLRPMFGLAQTDRTRMESLPRHGCQVTRSTPWQ